MSINETYGCVGNTIACHSGGWFDFSNPSVNDVRIRDIALALGNLCRYNGHCEFYSVAEHCVLCYHAAVEQYPNDTRFHLAVLMHDAAEAYTGDVAKPLKNMLPDFQKIENEVEEVIERKYGIDKAFEKEVKEIDNWALSIEKPALFPDRKGWVLGGYDKPFPGRIHHWSPEKASMEFMSCFVECWCAE